MYFILYIIWIILVHHAYAIIIILNQMIISRGRGEKMKKEPLYVAGTQKEELYDISEIPLGRIFFPEKSITGLSIPKPKSAKISQIVLYLDYEKKKKRRYICLQYSIGGQYKVFDGDVFFIKLAKVRKKGR